MVTGGKLIEEASELRGEVAEKLGCPVCFREFKSLGLLNEHLDKDHGFAEPGSEATSIGNGDRNQTNYKKHHKREKITTSHLKTFEYGSSRCHDCGQQLKKADEAMNCSRCGELFCKSHCQNLIKLNTTGQYDPTKGQWCICCYECFSSKPGYKDYGSVRDLTNSFRELRKLKNEDKQLQILQLENRLVRLVDGISILLRSHEDSILKNILIKNEVLKYEKTVTSWRNDNDVSNCFICEQSFGLILRKHHCRLCGNIVCDSEVTNCSNNVPISNLVNAADDVSFTEPREELMKQTASVRMCAKCTHNLYYGRKFNKDRTRPLSPLLSQCERIQSTSRSIINLLSHLTTSLEELERLKSIGQSPTQASIDQSTRIRTKLLRTVSLYTQLARNISTLQPRNTAERKILESVRMASSIFINEKLIHMKSLSSATASSISQAVKQNDLPVSKPLTLVFNNLSIKEIKRFREELMVLKEQKFLVETMVENAKKQRNFDEITTLNSNLQELQSRITAIQESLGDQGFA